MHRLFASLIVAILPAGHLQAEPVDRLRLPPTKAEVQKLRAQRPPASPCAQYGPGFAKIDGTDTCIKIGGSIGIGVGSSIGTGR